MQFIVKSITGIEKKHKTLILFILGYLLILHLQMKRENLYKISSLRHD
jgi:hypothetical protein